MRRRLLHIGKQCLFKPVALTCSTHVQPIIAKRYSTIEEFSQESKQTYFELYQQGDTLCKAKNFDEAIKVLTNAIKIGEDAKLEPFDAYILRAVAYEQTSHLFSAVEDVSTVLNRTKQFPDPSAHSFLLTLRARIHVQMKQYLASIVDYTKAMEVDKKNADSLRLLRAEVYFYNDDYKEAVRDYTTCIKNNFELQRSYMGRATCYCCTKEFQKAADDAAKVIEVVKDPKVKESIQNIRIFCLTAKDKKEWQNADMRQFKQLMVDMLFQNK